MEGRKYQRDRVNGRGLFRFAFNRATSYDTGAPRVIPPSLFMAATVTIRRWTGTEGAETKTDITSGTTVLNAQDAHEATASSSSNPTRIPDAGTNYSYWASIRLSADTTPSGTINAIEFFTDGVNNLGTGLGLNVCAANTYDQATGTAGETGHAIDDATNGHDDRDGSVASAFTFTTGSPKSIGGSISNPSTGDFGDFILLQLTVGSTASPGVSGSETMSLRYDET